MYVYVYLKSPCSENHVMLFICLCGVFNMLLDKLCANPLINTIAEYFLKTVVSQKVTDPDWLRLTQKHGLKQPSVCYVTKFNNQSRQEIDFYD